jgi:TolB protein
MLIACASVVVLAGCGGATHTAAKPSGLIAYTHQNRSGVDRIFVVRADGRGRHALTTQDSLDPVWSPDGSRLAYLDHTQRLVVMNADGSGRHVVSHERGIDEDEIASWSPDGRRLVFDATNGIGPEILFVVNADGSGKHRLGPLGSDPDWSPDGKQILFTTPDGLLALVGSDGRGRRLLTHSGCNSDPARWSPDGTSIAFVRSPDCWGEGATIDVLHADGTGMRPLTKRGGFYGAPAWSADGKQIVFSHGPELAAIGDLEIADVDGGHITRVTRDGRDFDPSWRH